MSEEKAEVVRRILQRLNRREYDTDLIADDVEYVNPPYAIEPGVRYGYEVDRFVDAGRESFKVSTGTSGVRFEWFQSHQEALEAAGVRS